ncbi:MAG: co-chaperone GroES [Enterobacteriaceae bacterium]|nr:co-chaperone GroES [Enterobacteriaceae bacterium]
MNNVGIRPLSDRVVIKRVEKRTTDGGIIIPETSNDKSQKGIVIAIGPGKVDNGKLQPLSLKCNDNVIFGKYSGTEITIKGQDYLIMKEEDVIGIIE